MIRLLIGNEPPDRESRPPTSSLMSLHFPHTPIKYNHWPFPPERPKHEFHLFPSKSCTVKITSDIVQPPLPGHLEDLCMLQPVLSSHRSALSSLLPVCNRSSSPWLHSQVVCWTQSTGRLSVLQMLSVYFCCLGINPVKSSPSCIRPTGHLEDQEKSDQSVGPFSCHLFIIFYWQAEW